MFFGKKRYENFDPSVETMRSKDSFNVYPVKRKWLKKKLKDKSVKEQVVEPSFINPYFSTSYNQMFYLCDFAEFATAKRDESKRPLSLKDNLFGTTSSGKALRTAALGSLAIGAGLVYRNRKGVKKLIDKPIETLRNHYTSEIPDPVTTMKTRMVRSEVKNPKVYNSKGTPAGIDVDSAKTRRKGTFEDPNYEPELIDTGVRETYSKADKRGFLGTNRKVNWGNVGKTVGVAGVLGGVPLTASYVFADKKDKDKIAGTTTKVYGATQSGMRDLRTWINTLHRVSR